MSEPRWLVLTWRLPATASSTPRVAAWRSLQKLGAVTLTPGAAVVPYSEHLLEQLEWIAEEIVQRGGDAYVLPVTELREQDEEGIRRRMRADAGQAYRQLREAADRLARESIERPSFERELGALQRGLTRAIEKDHFMSAARAGAERAIRQARRRKEA
ncbi:MAG TPA: Chromate resistance protein ChrB [Candidatus Dormibacteraeota bacterium]|nr:Chromate resistance protein ChrB [Candidatus Dormibacteraeota bacterium]